MNSAIRRPQIGGIRRGRSPYAGRMQRMERVRALVARVQRWKPVRVVQHYAAGRGPILAGGLAFQSLFAVFAALWIVFSIAGLVITSDLGLRRALLALIADAIP